VCIILCNKAILYKQAIFGMKPQAGGGFVGDINPSPGSSVGGNHREKEPSYEDALSAEMVMLHGAVGRKQEQVLAVKEHLLTV
jgi:hypothetical protein